MSNIGICGAHRTGKTTLAKALAKTLNMPFIEIGTSAIFAANHLDPAKPMDFRTRLYIQQQILKHAVDIWFEMDEAFVCDRTPIDMMAYTLAEVQGHTLDKELEWELAGYLRDCKEATEKYFNHLVLIPPAIPITAAMGKASLSRGYIEHIHRLCVGFFHDTDSMQAGCCLPRSLTNLGDRVKFVTDFVSVRDR
jgi:predicted ATPase